MLGCTALPDKTRCPAPLGIFPISPKPQPLSRTLPRLLLANGQALRSLQQPSEDGDLGGGSQARQRPPWAAAAAAARLRQWQ